MKLVLSFNISHTFYTIWTVKSRLTKYDSIHNSYISDFVKAEKLNLWKHIYIYIYIYMVFFS